MQDMILIIIIVISFILMIVSYIFNLMRYKNIAELPSTVISKKTQRDNLKRLKKEQKLIKIVAILNCLNLFVPNGLIKFTVPAIIIVITTNMLVDLFDEIDTLDVSKGEINTVYEFREQRKDDAKKKAEAIRQDRLKAKKEAEDN